MRWPRSGRHRCPSCRSKMPGERTRTAHRRCWLPEEVRSVEELDAGDVPVRIYRPGPGDLPGLVYLHGGGWVLGSLDSHDPLCRTLAARSGCAVIAVGYRLAPEHPYPAAIEDALDPRPPGPPRSASQHWGSRALQCRRPARRRSPRCELATAAAWGSPSRHSSTRPPTTPSTPISYRDRTGPGTDAHDF